MVAGVLLVVSFAVMVTGAAVFTKASNGPECAWASATVRWAASWRP